MLIIAIMMFCEINNSGNSLSDSLKYSESWSPREDCSLQKLSNKYSDLTGKKNRYYEQVRA